MRPLNGALLSPSAQTLQLNEAAQEPKDSSQDQGQASLWKARRCGGWMHPSTASIATSQPATSPPKAPTQTARTDGSFSIFQHLLNRKQGLVGNNL